MLPSTDVFTSRSHGCELGFLRPAEVLGSSTSGTNASAEVGFEPKSCLPGFACELPKMDEGGGAPAGVNEFAEDGGGPAGVVEGCGRRLLNSPLGRDRRESGVEGGLEENGTAKCPDMAAGEMD